MNLPNSLVVAAAILLAGVVAGQFNASAQVGTGGFQITSVGTNHAYIVGPNGTFTVCVVAAKKCDAIGTAAP